MSEINYKYNEKELLKEFSSYVDKTYEQHYSKDRFQATEFIMDGGHGEGFCICLLYTSPSPRDVEESRMPSSA